MKIYVPAVRFPAPKRTLARRLDSLRGARIALVDGWGTQLDDGGIGIYPTMEVLADLLQTRLGIESATWQHKESMSRPESEESIARLATEVVAVINGEGLCGSCTRAAVLDGIAMEAAGLPSITIIGDRFEAAARLHAEAAGLPELPMLIEPSGGSVSIELDGKQVAEANFSLVVEALTGKTPQELGYTDDFVEVTDGSH